MMHTIALRVCCCVLLAADGGELGVKIERNVPAMMRGSNRATKIVLPWVPN
ncbi:MAG TPA: hypothetical protein VMV69_23860 [Pirellulales bacterium]|nr:hypothetical protein [Pirellulales bacterium]